MNVSLYGTNNEAINSVERVVERLDGVRLISRSRDTEMALSVGGDGTFLRTAADVGVSDIPILGINAGHLGFLTDVPLEEIDAMLPAILTEQQYEVDYRNLLQLEISDCPHYYHPYALNEVAILKRDHSSMVSVSVWIDGRFLNQYDADGLVIATPTGSTAYALSGGGPILDPSTHCWVIVPIAPHTLTTRPLVIRDECTLDIEVRSRNRVYLVAVDGETTHLTTQSHLHLTKAHHQIGIVRRLESSFYDILRNKLSWGRDGRYL